MCTCPVHDAWAQRHRCGVVSASVAGMDSALDHANYCTLLTPVAARVGLEIDYTREKRRKGGAATGGQAPSKKTTNDARAGNADHLRLQATWECW